MISLEFFWTLDDIIGWGFVGLLIVGTILFFLIKWLCSVWDRIFYYKAYAKVFTDSPQMMLDRKWGVKYRKHFWNKWKEYKDPKRKYSTDYLQSEASNVASKIRKGVIRVD